MGMNYELLYALIDQANLENNQTINYNGLEFRLRNWDFEPDSSCTGLAFSEDKQRIKLQVLIKNGLIEEERRLVLLHEIVEVCLMRYHGYKQEGAHKIAEEHEKKYLERSNPQPN